MIRNARPSHLPWDQGSLAEIAVCLDWGQEAMLSRVLMREMLKREKMVLWKNFRLLHVVPEVVKVQEPVRLAPHL